MLAAGMNEYGNTGNLIFTKPANRFSNVLLEIAFLSNVYDESKIINQNFMRLFAKQVYLIVDFLKQAK